MYREHDNKSVVPVAGSLLLTLLTGFTVWFPAFWWDHTLLHTQGGGTLYRVLTPFIDLIPTYAPLITLLVMVAMGGILCWQCATLRLLKTTSLLPILFTVLLTGVFVSEHGISPGLPAALCLYIAFARLIAPTTYEDALWNMLETGFFISLSSLFVPTCIFYLPICWIGMQRFNRLSASHLLSLCIGVLIPYVLLFSFWFLTDKTDLIAYQWQVLSHQFCVAWQWPMHQAILLGLIGVTLLVALMGFLHQPSDRIHPRAVGSLGFVWAFAALLLCFLYHNAHHTPTLVLFTSLVLTHYFHNRSKKITKVFFYAFISCLLFVYVTQFTAY